MATKASWLILLTALALVGCSDKSGDATNAATTDTNKPAAKPGDKPGATAAQGAITKLLTEDAKVGTGPAAEAGDLVVVDYTGKLGDGTVFDTSLKQGGNPFSVVLGMGQVIKGWDQGLVGMKKGGHRKLSIPYVLAYGDRGQDKIPAKSDLFFEVDMLDIVKKGDDGYIDNLQDKEKIGQGPAIRKGDKVSIDYSVKLPRGEVADSSEAGKPFSFKVGDSEVIAAIDAAVVGMKKGGEREIKSPPALAYGERGNMPKIPGNMPVYIHIKVVSVTPGK